MANDRQKPEKPRPPVWIKKTSPKYERLLRRTYKPHQIIVFFKQPPTTQEIDEVKLSFKEYIDPSLIEILKCDNCDIPVQLWKADNIHTFINTEGVRAGGGPPSTTVGEEYSLNFFNNIPFEKKKRHRKPSCRVEDFEDKKEKIVVAVLDTGLDTQIIDKRYLWQEDGQGTSAECYKSVSTGWNFLNDIPDFDDDNPNKHGSIVSQYIINQFKKSPDYAVQIMPLKTHDKKGTGDLFSIICAIHFAIAKGAHIINASWGFYYYYSFPIPYLKELITVTLKKKGILFITATGNKNEDEEIIAKEIYQREHGISITDDELRNLALHNFHPAYLTSNENSIITVTTTDGKTVSPTQNYSNIYADLGVMADHVSPDSMKFQLPFADSSSNDLIGGSSFATAIASGIIGAFCDKRLYQPDIQKQLFFDELSMLVSTGQVADIFVKEISLEKKHIKHGAYTKKMV